MNTHQKDQQHLQDPEGLQSQQSTQDVLDALPPAYAIWVSPRKKGRGKLSYADVALFGNNGSGIQIKVVINPDPEVPFNRKEAAAREESIALFDRLTAGYTLLFYDADKDLKILNGYISRDSDICCVKQDIATAFGELDENEQLKTFTFDEAVERIGISCGEGLLPAQTNAVRLLNAWVWGIRDYLEKREQPNAAQSVQ